MSVCCKAVRKQAQPAKGLRLFSIAAEGSLPLDFMEPMWYNKSRKNSDGEPERGISMGKVMLRDGFEHMDFVRVTEMLSGAAWSIGIGLAEVQKGARHSALVVGAFDGAVQVGYARVISDCTRFAYVSDVYVDDAYRHQGIAKRMMEHLLAHELFCDVYQWYLKSEANTLYEKLGFVPLTELEKWLEIKSKRPNR